MEIRNTRLAGRNGGLSVAERRGAVAAAVYLAIKPNADGEKTLVCDLAAAIDATVLRRTGDKIRSLSTMGDRVLGVTTGPPP